MPQWRVQNTFQVSDTLAWVKGAHNVKSVSISTAIS